MPRQFIVWDNFEGGEEGRSRPSMSEIHNNSFEGNGMYRYKPPNSFRGINVWQYPSGIGPRPPLRLSAITGLPVGVPHMIGVQPGNANLIVITGAASPYNVYEAPIGGAAVLRGTCVNPPSDYVFTGSSVLFTSDIGAGFSQATGAAPVAVAALPAGHRIVQYGDQTVVATGSSLRWSAPRDPTSWPAANSVSIGINGGTIEDLVVQRGKLVVLLGYGEIWQVAGALGTNESYSRIDIVANPQSSLGGVAGGQRHGAVSRQSGYWFPLSTTKYFINFTGARAYPVEMPDMDLVGYNGLSSAVECTVPTLNNDSFVAAAFAYPIDSATSASLCMWAVRDGMGATRHVCPDLITSTTRHIFPLTLNALNDPGVVGFAVVSATTSPQVYIMSTEDDHPAKWAATNANYKDGGSGLSAVATFRTGEVWDPEGGNINVASVIVDYSFVNPAITGFTSNPAFDIRVESTQPTSDTRVDASSTVTFTPPTTANQETVGLVTMVPPYTAYTHAISRGRASFQFGDQQPGGGFRICLDNWRDILIHRITAVVETTPAVF